MVHDAPEMMGQDLFKLVAMGRERCSERRGCIIRAMAGYRFMSVVVCSECMAHCHREGRGSRDEGCVCTCVLGHAGAAGFTVELV